MNLIACLDAKNGIGKDNKLLVSIPEDMKFFRETTKDSVLIMGRKTLFSFRDKAPLKNRINIVFTNKDSIKNEYENYDNIFFAKNIAELNDLLKNYTDKKIFVIGGASIYNMLLSECDTLYITRLSKDFEADTYFPDINNSEFKIVSESENFTFNDINYRFLTYKRI